MLTIAALYVDPRGPYVAMSGVDPWDAQKDARLYQGPHPVVAHPPCGAWGDLHRFHQKDDGHLAPIAVEQVRTWGGVLEHPQHSKLWKVLDLPRPGELPDAWGGWSLDVDQVAWGHPAKKPTRLYFVGVDPRSVQPLTGGEPTHCVGGGTWRGRIGGPRLLVCSAQKRRRTPVAFAEWLVALARTAAPRQEVA